MARRVAPMLLLIWACFVARAGWHAVLLPLWEGFDEWAHVAYIQRLAAGKGLPLPGQTRISREVQASLSLTPLPAVPLASAHLTHDDYWRLPEPARTELRRRLDSLPRSWAEQETTEGEKNYEAQQPPLYYLMMAPLERLLRNLPLPGRVLALRLAGVLLASLLIPLIFGFVARQTQSEAAGLAAAALAAAMPLPAMTAARVGNDALSMVLFATLLWAVARAGPGAGFGPALAAGAALGAGLLTKAYFLTAIPALALLYGGRLIRANRRRSAVLAESAVLFGASALASFWWYWRNWRWTGTWSGLQQLAAERTAGPADLLREALHVDWLRFADIAFKTHLWIGHWSFLQVRGWMYDVFLLAYGLAAAGLILRFVRRGSGAPAAQPALAPAILFCAWFWLGLAYHEVTFARLGMSSSAGWYAVAVVSAEVFLLTAGWRSLCPGAGSAWRLAGGIALFALLDLYASNFVLLPYYTGFVSHDASGRLPAFHLSQLGAGGISVLFERAGIGSLSAFVKLLAWAAHTAATIALPVAACKALSRPTAGPRG